MSQIAMRETKSEVEILNRAQSRDSEGQRKHYASRGGASIYIVKRKKRKRTVCFIVHKETHLCKQLIQGSSQHPSCIPYGTQ